MQAFKITLLSLLSLFLINCGGGGSDSATGAAPTPTPTPDAPVAGVVDNTKFFVTPYVSEKYDSHIRTLGSFSTACEIDASLTDQDLICIIDANERDLQFHGMTLLYNAPSNMCAYLVRETYWYHNWEIGQGPSNVFIEVTFDAGDNWNGVTPDCTIDGVGPLPCTTANFPDLSFEFDDAGSPTVTCNYNHTDNDGPNCCLGDYTQVIAEDHSAAGNPSTSAQSEADWGGSVSACIGGAGKASWSKYDKYGYPIGEIVHTAVNGVSATYDTGAPISKARSSTLSVANFYTTAANPHQHDGFVDASTSNLPYFIEPIDDRNGTLFDSSATLLRSGNAPYDFRCLDEAGEVRNRIRVYIRDWDDRAEYDTYITSSGVSGNPDLGGTGAETEGSDCLGVFGYCNDNFDLDDFLYIIHGGSYDTTPAAATDRFFLFPREDY